MFKFPAEMLLAIIFPEHVMKLLRHTQKYNL